MKKTENYAMPYPEQDDYFNVEDFQDMMVSVDDLMKKLSDSGAQISSDAEHLYNQTKAQMDNIQKRMNAFTALRDGSTTGDAELKDIRVAYDGKEYGNAGEAVREQASDIHKALFGAGASIWSKAKSESKKYVVETKGICILNERFTAAGVVTKISRGTFAENESTLNLDRECSAYIVEFEKNPGTVYMPSAETIKIVSTTKIIFEANGNARCWVPVEKGQYLAVDSTATAYTSESNHVPYMLYDQANETLECRGFGSAGSIEPVDPYSLALEYKLEYDMDDTGLVKQIDANREAAASLKEDIFNIVTISDNKNLVNWKSVKLATYLQTNGIETSNENHWCTDFFEVEPNTTYCLGMTAPLGDAYWANCCQYDSNKTFISGTNVSNGNIVTTNANTKYIRFGRRYENASGSGSVAGITVDNYLTADYVINKSQFQKGTVPTKIIDDLLNPYIKVTADNISEEALAEIRNRISNNYWYKDKYILTYGDSVVEQKKWQDYVKNYFGCTAVYNNGIGGTCVANDRKTATLWNGQVINGWMCGDDRIDLARRNYTLTQAVILLGGHNDFASNIPLGDLETLDDTKFKSAYALMIKKMIGIFPNAKIFALTPANSRLSKNATNRDTECKNSLGLTMSDYANAVKEVCAVYGIPCIDIFGESGMSVLNGSEFVTDIVHPNDLGGKRIANVVINGLKRFEPIDL